MGIIISLLINAVAVFGVSYFLPGIVVENFWTAIIVAVVLGIINTFIKPVLVILTLPITIVTLGLFALVINGFIIWLVGQFVPGFGVENFWWAIIFSILISIVSSLLNGIFNRDND